ncbi:membrane protein [Streptomyces minutiscleroticus]|uniref:Membrane protein n=1 Tax=Streptomyces minutiscleroticus TaxID=68238 RepID=A0A918U0A8_9ACTN|nr:CopD family protein [Streptomyces minutiscleroticus]GGX78730.1 membrane protein [Streptomyces minutiscleroticus]
MSPTRPTADTTSAPSPARPTGPTGPAGPAGPAGGAEEAAGAGAEAAGSEAAGTADPDRIPGRRAAAGRSAAVLVLVAVAALVPLLGPSAALSGTGEAEAPGTGGITLLRTVLFAALCVPAGELLVGRLARRVPGAAPKRPRSRAPAAAAAGCVAALGLASVVATGNLLPDRLSDIDIGGLYRTRDGALALLEVNAFVVAGLCALSRRPAAQVWPLAAVAVAEALRAHPVNEHSPLVGSALTLVHVTCAVLWTGGLLHALRLSRLWRGPAGAALLGLYARVAAVLFAAVTATGVCSTLRRMPPETVLEQLTTTAYGRVLLAKVLFVAVVAVLALRARRGLRRAADPSAAYVPARAEVVVLGAVVAVSALLTAVPVPIRW